MASCSQPHCGNSVLGQRLWSPPGVTRKPRTRKLYKGRLSLLNALSDVLEWHTVENMPQALKLEAAHFFGSLKRAVTALRKQRNRLPGWNRRKITTVLSRLHRSKESLAYARARRERSWTGERRRILADIVSSAATIGRASKGCQLSRNTIHRLGNGATVYRS
jgi:hypothetical protein